MNNRDFECEPRALVEGMFLYCLNNYLYKTGLIFEHDKDKMTVETAHRKSSKKKKPMKMEI